MLEIIIEATKARTAPNFLLKDIPGTTGRLDVVIRSLIAAFSFPKKVINNLIFTIILLGLPDPPKLFKFHGKEFQSPKNEIDGALFFKDLIKKSMRIEKETNILDSVDFLRMKLKDYIDNKLQNGELVFYLIQNGNPIDFLLDKIESNKRSYINILIGDQLGFKAETLNYLREKCHGLKLRGNRVYLSSQCIKYLIFELEKRNYFK
jgi:tRNA (pseudouridine54-N1)-methyltransferase